jgi:beta-lactamase class A
LSHKKSHVVAHGTSNKLADKVDTKAIANFRGEEPIFPASIVKLFYLVAVHQWLEDKKLKETEELKRACADMIIESSNDATHYVLDLLTDTTAGPELPPQEMADWAEKRNTINRYFQSLGYKNINVNQKTWGDGPYGRERVFVGKERENRNKLTTNAAAKLLADIVTGHCINQERSKAMLELLARDFTQPSDDVDNQATGFMGSCLSKGAKLWSKAGWMSTARHDAAYIELPNGICFILVVFVSNHARDYWILPTIAKKVIRALELHHGVAASKLR